MIADEFTKAVELRHEFRRIVGNFMQTELETSLEFVQTALSAGDDLTKRERNRTNARKAYDILMRCSRQFAIAPSAARDFAAKFARLKASLQSLGETDL